MHGTGFRTVPANSVDDPLGAVELATAVKFGVRAAALAGIAVPVGAAAGRPSIFDAPAGMSFTWHITCSSHTL
jgi:hypothetical protein